MLYLDYAATTPVDPRVLEEMTPYFCEVYGNPSSRHAMGEKAQAAVEEARKTIANQINAKPSEVIFTGGACEANNLCIKGIAECYEEAVHFITSSIEHKSMLAAMKDLEEWGHKVTYVKPDAYGVIDPEDIKRAIQPDTILCSIMHVNNEIGTIQPIHDIADACHEQGVIFHTDATQSFGKMPLDIADGLDLVSASAHKIYGPKGTGFLYCNSEIPLKCQISGGSQENGARAGTINVPGVVGFAKATKIACGKLEEEYERLEELEGVFLNEIYQNVPLTYLQGDEDYKVPWICNLCFYDVDGEQLRQALSDEGICISRSSACAKSGAASHVLDGMGTRDDLSSGALRISFGRNTTKDDVIRCARAIAHYVDQLRG